MADPEHLAKLSQGPSEWRTWRNLNRVSAPDLSGAWLARAVLDDFDLKDANLESCDLQGAHLRETNLTRANLKFAVLSGADLGAATLTDAKMQSAMLIGSQVGRAYLQGVDLTAARLTNSNFAGSNLKHACLVRADLRGVNLGGADLSEANLDCARLAYTSLCDLDLSEVRGLETVDHRGPSSIGVDTIFKSRGKIPAAFLRGAGVPGALVDYVAALAGAAEPIQFFSCFISHSHADHEFCARLHEALEQLGTRVWFAPEDMKGGKKIHEQIESAIQMFDRLLLVLSPASMSSNWVATEVAHARQRESREGRQILFPIALIDFDQIRRWQSFDAETGKDMAREVREYFIPDFSSWRDPVQFERTLARLLRDLRATEASVVRTVQVE
jgi:uncharacterized protein YjbI with pentapeptide repeats